MYFEYAALTVVVSGIVISLLYTVLTSISPVSSTFKSRKKIVKTISLDQEGIICELGAGWGPWLFLWPGNVRKPQWWPMKFHQCLGFL